MLADSFAIHYVHPGKCFLVLMVKVHLCLGLTDLMGLEGSARRGHVGVHLVSDKILELFD